MAEEILDNLDKIDNETLEREILATLRKNQRLHLGLLLLLFASWVVFLIKSHNMWLISIIMKIYYGQEHIFVAAMVVLMALWIWAIVKFSDFFSYPDAEQWQKTQLPQQVLIAFAAVFALWQAVGQSILFNQFTN